MVEVIKKIAVVSVIIVVGASLSGCPDCNCKCYFPDDGVCCGTDVNGKDNPVGHDAGDDVISDTGSDVDAVPTDLVPHDDHVDMRESDDGQTGEDTTAVDVPVDVPVDTSPDTSSDTSSDTGDVPVVCADGDPCEDGDPCTADDHCSGGVCVPGGPLCSEFEDCNAGVCLSKSVSVPAGAFYMGCNLSVSAADECSSDEFPYHLVTTPAYQVDSIEVTNMAFSAFLNQFGNLCNGESCVWWSDTDTETGLTFDGTTWGVRAGRGQYPVDNVSRQGAQAYCEWVGRSLCTEAQWEKAARGGCEFYGVSNCAEDSYKYPWGNVAPNCYLVNWGECGAQIAPVGSKVPGASLYGVLDLAGNLWEWVYDATHTSYLDAPTDGSAWGEPGTGIDGMLRGGGFQVMYGRIISVSNRSRQPLAQNQFLIRPGFRCCEVTAP